LWSAIRHRRGRALKALIGAGQTVVGLFLITSVVRSAAVPGRLIGASMIAAAIVSLLSRRDAGSLPWVVTRSLALTAGGIVAILFPEGVLDALTSIAALVWVAFSVLVLAISMDARAAGPTTDRGAALMIGAWLGDRPKSVDARQDLYARILYDGPGARGRVVRYLVLMSFAAVIGATGVITDSTAVVIGAMLIAPLMTPLMGMAISLVMGWPNRLGRSATVALTGILLTIGVSMFLGAVAPSLIDTAANSQIASRANPTTLDLVVAVAAGAAGAYGLSRPDVSDSLPGVAVAIALVPPLNVVGIAYSQGDWSSGNGALLLFTTNMLAILVMGGITFIITGVTPVRRVADNQYRVRTALAAVATIGAIVLGALLLNGSEVTTDQLEQSRAESTVDDWLEEAPLYSVAEADVEGDRITAVVVGPSEGIPEVATLADRLSRELGRDITVDIRLIVEERLTSENG
jgi:uncharacterized hydrophobic protein (TIGR00271 family)